MQDTANLESTGEQATSNNHTVVGVRFKTSGKVYTFEIDDNVDVTHNTMIVAESEMGLCLGRVVKPKHSIEKAEQPLKKVIRIATDKDIETEKNNRSFEEEARAFCIDKAKSRSLPMKIVAAETTLDRKRLIFYFTADGRIDFRELVRDLAAKFKTRIEMRQIGVRDEVKLIGGIGACGRETCCTLFLTSFEPVSIRMAKKQELVLTQSKLSGICGRLMCCLAYEYEYPAEKAEYSDTIDKTALTVTDEPYIDMQQTSDSDTVLIDETQQSPVCSCQNNICPLKEEHLQPSQSEIIEEQVTIKPAQGEIKKDLPQKAHPYKPVKHKDRGEPFSRRKKFWKKKKH